MIKSFLYAFIVTVLTVFFVLPVCAEELYVANRANGAIVTIDTDDHPSPASKRVLDGASTKVGDDDVFGMFVYNDELFVTNDSSISGAVKGLIVFDAKADGEVAPKRKITGLDNPRGVVVSGSEIFVGVSTSADKGYIKVFGINDDEPDSAKRTIECDFGDIKLKGVWAIAISGFELFVSDLSKICVFDINADLNVRPKRVIEHKSTPFSSAYGLAVDDNFVYVADFNDRIMIFPISANGKVNPLATISGAATQLSDPCNLVVKNGYIYASQYDGGSRNSKVNVYKTTDNLNAEPQWTYTNADFSDPWALAMVTSGYVRPSDHQQSGVNVSLTSNSENATSDTVLQTAYNIPPNFELRAPVGSFTATVDSPGANGVFRFNSTSLEGTTSDVRLYKCFETNGTCMAFGGYSTAIDPDTEGTWWLEDDGGNYIDQGATLTQGTNYWVNYVIKDNGIYDEDRTLGSIKDPAALGIGGGGGGCVMNPTAGFGLEWLLLAFATFVGLVARR
ncbi:hypothetical protein D0S45_07410 [Marinifilum sp. JC120]|nr:hypothetical protein D0S45_07410 [Marinifilum sp. JC120]